MYKTIDLCAGIGGIRKGFERTGHFYNVLSAEIDEYAARTYEYNFNGDNPRNDLTSDEFKQKAEEVGCDVLLAGFPCQPFSSQGNLAGFNDPTKGTIFFHIAQIVEKNRPKVVFLENVQNIVSHDKKKTIKVIVDTLENKLNYKIIGVKTDENGKFVYNKDSFVRNTRYFGLPQNRPRAYFIAFDRDLYGTLLDSEEFQKGLPKALNERLANNPNLNKSLNDILEDSVDLHYYMSATYLNTLERHAKRQKENGNGFGYFILNSEEHQRDYANTILATGGSGRERNLIIQKMPEHTLEEEAALRKKGGLNTKNIRIMTPAEWGRLQGFIGYGFINPETGEDEFSFPNDLPESQKYKQFGNSVSIPVIETMADYIYNRLSELNQNYEIILKNYVRRTNGTFSKKDVEQCLDVDAYQAKKLIMCMLNRGSIAPTGKGRGTRYYF